MTKYKMSKVGLDEFKANKRKYILPTIRAKLMYILSSGIGYTPDSLVSQVLLDPRLKATEGQIIGELYKLRMDGYVEVIEQ